MQTVAIGWLLYERTRSPLALGFVGLAQVLPVILLTLVSGHVADRFPRRRVLMIAEAALACAALGLAISATTDGGIATIYACLFFAGTARAFQTPARSALLPQIVPRRVFQNAVTWATGGFQLASVIGPALGGLVIALAGRATPIFIINVFAAIAYLTLVFFIRDPHKRTTEDENTDDEFAASGVAMGKRAVTFDSLVAGFRFVWRTQIIFAALTLDLFAVLLGGAVALLPIYAKDILGVGPVGLGWMLASPAIGAIVMTILLTHLPPLRRAGHWLLFAVAGFGAATIVFGLSRSFPLSLLMLFTLGALDQISVVIRSTLVQLQTPDEMRGRVSAVNGMFIGASNELGGFESGAAAAALGPIAAVVSGGIGTLIIVALVALKSPALRRYEPN